jgi:hypothetical protein
MGAGISPRTLLVAGALLGWRIARMPFAEGAK